MVRPGTRLLLHVCIAFAAAAAAAATTTGGAASRHVHDDRVRPIHSSAPSSPRHEQLQRSMAAVAAVAVVVDSLPNLQGPTFISPLSIPDMNW